MSFNIIEACKTIADQYKTYLRTTFSIKDPDYAKIFNQRLDHESSFDNGPFLEVNNSFEKGKSVQELIDEGILSKDFSHIERLYKIPNLYKHQEEAIRKAQTGANLIVTTGTGSGKTECFLIPIINELMREKENGTLCDGVRAMIIYPMNALANDQIDRLRKLFLDYPEITFGCYTGQTREEDEDVGKIAGALSQYKELNGSRVDEPRLRTPLKNERLSRAAMKSNPPHILITNYAMLEYLMLRPKDNVFFNGQTANHWKYIVMDEAHTYNNSTGIEVSMLLKRLIASIHVEKLQFILTSATLGDEKENPEIIQFASNLCSVPFKEDSIIRAKRVKLEKGEIKSLLKIDFFTFTEDLMNQGLDDARIIQEIENRYHFGIHASQLENYLYNLLIQDEMFWKLKYYLTTPKKIPEIQAKFGLNSNEITAFVSVCSKAEKNDSKLFDARYHMFLRAPEGVFITLAPHKDLFLTRKDHVDVDNKSYKVFEIATCNLCHSVYLLGYIKNDKLVQKSSADGDLIQSAFYVGDSINDIDGDNSLASVNMSADKYLLCPYCGHIHRVSDSIPNLCGHPKEDYITLIKVEDKDVKNGRVKKCVSCEYTNRLGVLKGFFSGQEASTSVIGTSLFEQLPESELQPVTKTISSEDEDNPFYVPEPPVVAKEKAKQFIAFSDSRQAAAYFSSYLNISYNNILESRIIIEALKNSKERAISFDTLTDRVSVIMRDNDISDINDYLENLDKPRNPNYLHYAKKAMMKLLINNRSINSLYSLGLLGFDFDSSISFTEVKGILSAKEVKEICLIFTLGLLYDGTVYSDLNDADNKEINHNEALSTMVEQNGDRFIKSFLPKTDTSSNRRLEYLMRLFKQKFPEKTEEQNKKLSLQCLKYLWEKYFADMKHSGNKSYILRSGKEHTYAVNPSMLCITHDVSWYQCSKCKKLTAYNISDVCPSLHCDGHLHKYENTKNAMTNHYFRVYTTMPIKPLRVVEHTAQLDKNEAYKYQNRFKDQEINVLSCSTTFEMGVDVGSLETVFMRNVPPSPSNYAQRAGRAGRSKESAAFALTFCTRSNHDYNFFNHPVSMIQGQILPPHFKIDNKKIGIRHVYSSALSFFFRQYDMYFKDAGTFILSKDNQPSGYDVFRSYLSQRPSDLKQYLEKSVPTTLKAVLGIDNFRWVDFLFSDIVMEDYPNLTLVKKQFEYELQVLKDDYDNAYKHGYSTGSINYRMKTYKEENIISFLSRNNILPRYGFPVDTVELETNKKANDETNDRSGLTLTRDMSMAISEYAPGCEIIANNKVYTSRYIRKVPEYDWKQYDFYVCEKCKTLNITPHTSSDKLNENQTISGTSTEDTSTQSTNLIPDEETISAKGVCQFCHTPIPKNRIRTFLIPEFGFIADPDVHAPSLVKPEKTYRTEATFSQTDDTSKPKTYLFGDYRVSLTSVSNNGDMVILNSSQFLVCPTCGYACEYDGKQSRKIKHKNSKGYHCSNEFLDVTSLGYKFKTDILQISFSRPLIQGADVAYEEAYSILQALILASCKELGIDNTEIQGCLQFKSIGDYNYILYDRTPGGAGHVKRINNDTTLYHILTNACNLAENCPNCDPDSSCYSCLRTYQNQRHHDILKRRYVYEYLKPIVNAYNPIDSDSGLETEFLNQLRASANSYTLSGEEENHYVFDFNGIEWKMEPQYYLDPTQGVVKPCQPDFVLFPTDGKHKKVAVFTDGFQYHNHIIDDDTVKRDAVRASGGYRVFSFSWQDIFQRGKGKNTALPVFESSPLCDTITKSQIKVTKENSFELLITYLSNPDSEEQFQETANAYLETILKSSETADENETVRLSHITKSDSLNVFELSDSKKLKFYQTKDSNNLRLIPFINDTEKEYRSEWMALLQFCNIMQFTDKLFSASELGLQKKVYDCLKLNDTITGTYSDEWKIILSTMCTACSPEQAIEFAKQCASKNYPIPENGYELSTGEIGELVWVKQKIAYLTDDQLDSDSKDAFIKNGFTIVQSFDDLTKLLAK